MNTLLFGCRGINCGPQKHISLKVLSNKLALVSCLPQYDNPRCVERTFNLVQAHRNLRISVIAYTMLNLIV